MNAYFHISAPLIPAHRDRHHFRLAKLLSEPSQDELMCWLQALIHAGSDWLDEEPPVSRHQQLNSLLNGPAREKWLFFTSSDSPTWPLRCRSIICASGEDQSGREPLNPMGQNWPLGWHRRLGDFPPKYYSNQVETFFVVVVSVITFIKMMWFTSYVCVHYGKFKTPEVQRHSDGADQRRGEKFDRSGQPRPHFSPIVFRK